MPPKPKKGKKKSQQKKDSIEQSPLTPIVPAVEEVEKKDEAAAAEEEPTIPAIAREWKPPMADSEITPADHYDVVEAWRFLERLPSCQTIYIKEKEQRHLQIMIGVNVSQEFPWKQIKYKVLDDFLDEIDEGDIVRIALKGFNPEDHLLVGYAPLLTQNEEDPPEGDPFIIFLNPIDAKKALPIIQNIELYERWAINKRLVKKPRRWVSLGSESEVNLTLDQQQTIPLEVEIQSVYPFSIPRDKTFSFRKSGDVRDGYVELLAGDNIKFENVIRRRVTVATQVAPKMIHMEQQTNPTFPANAWAQYLYEVNEEECLDESSEDEAHKEELSRASKTPTPATLEPQTPKPPPEMSSQMELLLESLEFSEIDVYRDDYISIYEAPIEHYTSPYLKETLCFANITKSYDRYVCGIDWYPNLSGLLVISYTFTTPCTIESVSHRVDVVQRAVLQPNPILMWSFADNLNYKLEFESPQEVTTISFCPHDGNLMFGGGKNGQLIMWDLQGRAEKFDTEEVLTANQAKYRVHMADFLKWTIQINEDAIVAPILTSALEVSQKSTITGIYWLGKQFFLNTFGKAYVDSDRKNTHKFFATSSLDGTISFWDLDATYSKKKQEGVPVKRDQHKDLGLQESAYKNKTLKPMFTVVYNEPITSIICDSSVFSCLPLEPPKNRKVKKNFPIRLVPKDPNELRQTAISSTLYGRIERINWLGSYADADGREYVTQPLSFARVHDGPVVAMRKNPFYPSVFVSIGRNIFAVWKENYYHSPIFWRKCVSEITAVAWSEARPAVFFVTRMDGNMEVWDILARDDDASYNDIFGGGVVTAVSEHRPSDPEKLLGIGDYNSSFRIVQLPKNFFEPETNELERVKEYFRKEEERKIFIQAWERVYFEKNRDIIEAKRQAELETRKELERIEKENVINARKVKEEVPVATDELKSLPYTERMKRQWDELNLKRMMLILMSRKRVDEEQLERDTKLEKLHLAYEDSKKEALMRIQQRLNEEIANVRSRILPNEVVELRRIDLIQSSVLMLLQAVESYKDVEDELNDIINNFDDFNDLSFIDFVHRGNHRRYLLNKSMGGNTDRLYWYETAQEEDKLDDGTWGFEQFLQEKAEYLAQKESVQTVESDAFEETPSYINTD